VSKKQGWPAPEELTYDGFQVELEEEGTTLVTGIMVWALSNCVYAAVTLWTLNLLKDVGAIDFSFTWQQIGITVTAIQFARIWDRTLMR
jgi:hypothetical protein